MTYFVFMQIGITKYLLAAPHILVVCDTNLSASTVNVDLHKLHGWDFPWKMSFSHDLKLLTTSAIIILKSVN